MPNPVVRIDFEAEFAKLKAEMRSGSQAFKQAAGEIESAATFAKTAVFALAATVGVSSFVGAVKGASEAADAIAKLGDRFGVANEQMVGIVAAGDLVGASQEGIANGFKAMSTRLTEAVQKGGEAADSFRQLGLDAAELSRLPVDQQFERIVGALGNVENAAQRNALGAQVLGRGYGELAGFVAEGAGAIRAAQEDAQAFGTAISRVDAAKLEAANDAMTRAKQATQGLFTTIALNVAPAIKVIADAFSDSAKANNGFRDQVSTGMETVVKAVAYGANAVQYLQFVWGWLKLGAGTAIDWIIQQLASLDRAYTDTMNSLANSWIGKKMGMDTREYNATLQEIAEISANRVKELDAELEKIAARGMPADEIIASYRAAVAKLDTEARTAAARRQALNKEGAAGISAIVEPVKEDKETQALAGKLAALQLANTSELEQLRIKHEEKQRILEGSLAAGLLLENEYNTESYTLAQQYEEAKTRLEDEQTKKRFGISNVYRQLDMQSTGAWLGQMASLMQSKNRSMFEVGKAAAIGETVFNTIRAAQGAYAAFASIPIVGPAMGIAAAVAATVAGRARVQQIRSTSFGGGGGASPVYTANPVTGNPTSPISPLQSSASTTDNSTQSSQTVVNVNVYGTIVGSGGMQEFTDNHIAPALQNLFGRDGVVIPPNSRQALELTVA